MLHLKENTCFETSTCLETRSGSETTKKKRIQIETSRFAVEHQTIRQAVCGDGKVCGTVLGESSCLQATIEKGKGK
jgi:hypothetical protein